MKKHRIALIGALALLLAGGVVALAVNIAISNAVCKVILPSQPGVYQQGRCTGTFTPDNPSYRSLILGDGALAYWRMGDAVNSTALKDELNANPGVQDNAAGVTLGNAGAFPNDPNASWSNDANLTYGEGRYWNVPDSASLDLTGSVTVEVWFKNTAQYAGSYRQALLDKVPTYSPTYETNGGGGYGLWVREWYGSASFRVCHNGTYDCNELIGSGTVQCSTDCITPNVWHYIVGTFDGTTLRLYLDGNLDNSMAATKTLAVGHLPLRIGEQGDLDYFQGNGYPVCTTPPQQGYCYPITGALQDVAIYNHALTAAQVTAHWNARTAVGP